MTALASARPRGRDGLVSADDVLRVVSAADGWVTVHEIRSALGQSRSTTRDRINQLTAAGMLIRSGERRLLRFALPGTSAAFAPANVPLATAFQRALPAVPLDRLRGPQVLAAKMRIAAVIRSVVAAEPGTLTERALAVGVADLVPQGDRDAVALVCGELLDTDVLRLAANGTYFPGASA